MLPTPHSHPKTSSSRPDMGGRPAPGGRHAGRAAPPWCRLASRTPKGPRGGRHAEPTGRSGIGTLSLERGPGWCPSGGGGGPTCHWEMLGRRGTRLTRRAVVIACIIWGAHTVDVRSRGQRWILRQGLSHVVICAVHIVVFLVHGAMLAGPSIGPRRGKTADSYACKHTVKPVKDMLLDDHCQLQQLSRRRYRVMAGRQTRGGA